MDRAGDVGRIGILPAAGKLRVSCAQDLLGRLLRLVVEHIAAVDHEACDLQHRKAEDRDQDDRNDADVTKRFHAARPLDLLRSENACAAAATALADDTLGAGAGAGSGSDGGRAAIAILDSRRITLSPSASWLLQLLPTSASPR